MKAIYIGALMHTMLMSAQIPTGAVGDWPFDNNAQDVSGNGNNGTVNGAIPAYDRFGQANKAYKFNGVNSKIVVPNNTSVDIGNGVDFTFAYWQKAYANNVGTVILSKHESGTWNGYNFIANNQADPGYCTLPGHIYFYTASGAQQDACSNNAVLNDTLWHFVVGIYDATNNKSYLYFDNVLQSDIGQSSGTISNSANLSFGYDDYLNNNFFNGVLDGARLYKRMLTANELTALFNESCAGPTAPLNATSVINLNICSHQSTTLNATGTGTINWYSTPTSTAVLGTGSTYSTPLLNAGIYSFYVSATTCTNSARTAITVTVSECLEVGKYTSDNLLYMIYPNPNNGTFKLVSGKISGNSEVMIMNQLGEIIYKAKIKEQEFVIEKDLTNGIYFLNITDDNKTVSIKKLIIQH
jgi:hypothetical protein